jgi:copper(I)-binding protein
MRWKFKNAPIFISLVVFLCACASSPVAMEIVDAWARPAESGANSAAYFEIDSSPEGDTLLSASSQIAERTEIHRTTIDSEGKARMEQQSSVEIPGGEITRFAPGGYHVMFIHLHAALLVGDIFSLTLNFERAGEVTIDVEVQTP